MHGDELSVLRCSWVSGCSEVEDGEEVAVRQGGCRRVEFEMR
jgi:hypothetical protein